MYEMTARTVYAERDGWKVIIHLDEEGNEIRVIRVMPVDYKAPPREPTQREDPTTYHREYYRKVRSKRDQRASRGPYKQKTQ